MNRFTLLQFGYAIFFTLLCTGVSQAQNSMLSNPAQNVPITPLGTLFDGMGIASNGTDVVLLLSSSNANKIYALDIADNNPADASANTITAIPNFESFLSGATGFPANAVTILDLETNPISKSVYVLVRHAQTGQTVVVSIKGNGSNVSVLNMMNQTFSAMSWGGSGLIFNDMTYGNGNLYASSGQSFTLNGTIATFPMPFVNSSSATLRSTTVFKTNWGNQYFTDAPLEKMDFAANVNSNDRIMGVTVCAPGFSIETQDIPGSGLLQVTEDFNVRYSPAKKVVHQFQNGVHYLFNLHGNFSPQLMRIGERFIDGSQVTGGQYNTTALKLRTTSGTRSPGLVDSDLIIYSAANVEMMAFHDDYNLLVVENDSLKLFPTGVNMTNTQQIENNVSVEWFPNPATNQIQVNLGDINTQNVSLSIFTVEGKEVKNQTLTDVLSTVNVKDLSVGQYFLSISSDNETVFSDKLIIKE